jgi:hypothetical protein
MNFAVLNDAFVSIERARIDASGLVSGVRALRTDLGSRRKTWWIPGGRDQSPEGQSTTECPKAASRALPDGKYPRNEPEPAATLRALVNGEPIRGGLTRPLRSSIEPRPATGSARLHSAIMPRRLRWSWTSVQSAAAAPSTRMRTAARSSTRFRAGAPRIDPSSSSSARSGDRASSARFATAA